MAIYKYLFQCYHCFLRANHPLVESADLVEHHGHRPISPIFSFQLLLLLLEQLLLIHLLLLLVFAATKDEDEEKGGGEEEEEDADSGHDMIHRSMLIMNDQQSFMAMINVDHV